MAEALVERAIGGVRALVHDAGRIVEAHFEPAWPPRQRAGAVVVGRLRTILVPGRRGLVELPGGEEALLEPLPALTEGAALCVEVVRSCGHEAGRPRLAKLRHVAGAAGQFGGASAGPDLEARLVAAGHAVTAVDLQGFGGDRLEDLGWGETVAAARSGHVAFAGGLLTISPTAAMTVIDIDGPGDPLALAEAAAHAVADAIRRFDIGGSIGIDFPSVTGKAARVGLDTLLAGALPAPFEKTAINGFGFVQIVRPRVRPGLVERVREPGFAALELLRRAQRGAPGPRTLVAHPVTIAWLQRWPEATAALSRAMGGAVALRADPALAMEAGDVILG